MRTCIALLIPLLSSACTPAVPDPVETDADADTDADSDTDADTDADTDTDTDPVVITGESAVHENPYNPFSALVTVTLDQDAEVVVTYGEGALLTHTTPAVSVSAGVPSEVLVLGLRADRDYGLQVVAQQGDARWEGEALTYQTDPLPLGWPVCSATFFAEEETFDEDEVVCTQGVLYGGQYLYFCTDYWGEPVFSIKTNANDSLMSMHPLMDGSWASTSFTTSKVALFAPTGEQTAELAASYFSRDTRFEHEYIDSHEMIQISAGPWKGAIAFITDAYETFGGGSYKLGNGLIVFDPVAREVLYDFSFHGELGDQEAFSPMMPYSRAGWGDYAEDWNHANSLVHGADPDGREYFLISLKAQDWIFKLYPDTDELAWRLGFDGEFDLVDDIDASAPASRSNIDWFYHQHGLFVVDPDLTDADGRPRILLFDNGYPRHDSQRYRWDLYYSRVVQVAYDETAMRAELEFVYGDTRGGGPDGFFSSTCGNTIRLQDQSRVIALDGEGDTMFEISYPDGQRRWEMTCVSEEWCEYRVRWYPSLYETTWFYEQ